MSQILKLIETRNECQMILYTNIRVSERDNLEVRRLKNALKRSVSRYLKSKRRCIEALLQHNFTGADYYCVLTFRDEKLPDRSRYADHRFSYFVRQLQKSGVRSVRYLKVLEHKHGAGRYHFHAVVSGDGLTERLIRETWGRTYGQVYVSRFRPWKAPRLAGYLAKEAPDIVGGRVYSRSRPPNGLIDPPVTRESVSDEYQLIVPHGCELIERAPRAENAYGSVETLSWLTPAGQEPKRK